MTARKPATDPTFDWETLHAPGRVLFHPRRELARRAGGGIEVTLYWSPHDDSTSIELRQSATEETLLFNVARDQALDAFYHPFAHLPTASAELMPVFYS